MIDHRGQGLEVIYLGLPSSHGVIARPADFDSLNLLRFNMGSVRVFGRIERVAC